MTLHDPLDALPTDDIFTTMGLLLECHTGLRAALADGTRPLGLVGSDCDVMMRLARSPGHRLRMTELAAQTMLSNSGLTRVVDRLEKLGLVQRHRHDDDRRVIYASLNEDGLAKVAAMVPLVGCTIERYIVDVLDPDELATFTASLRKIRDVVHPLAKPVVLTLAPQPPE